MVTKKSTKRSPAKKSIVKKAAPRKSVLVGLQKEQQDFMSFNITVQTLYWLILGSVVILFTMWILRVQADIQGIYDQIDANMAEINSMVIAEDDQKAKED